MENTNWLRQTPDKPLFSDLLWSRPENKRAAGKLLIAGGNSHNFSALSSAYSAAQDAGVGTLRVLLPISLEKALGRVFPEAEFAPATPSGSLAKAALANLCDAATWADGVLLAGDFGKNSETAILLENFTQKYDGPLTLTGDSLDYFLTNTASILNRAGTHIVADLGQLQKLLYRKSLIKHSMDISQLIRAVTRVQAASTLTTVHNGQLIVAQANQAASTPSSNSELVKIAAYISTWTLQHPNQIFEALASAAYCFVSDQ